MVLQNMALGTLGVGAAYNTANTVPTSLYTLMIGGALNSVLVPQLVRARSEHPDGGRAHEQRLVTMMLVVLVVGTVTAVAFAPQIASLYMASDRDLALTVAFTRLLLPQILFYGVYFLLGQLLNARGRFAAMGWAPMLNNVVLIALFAVFYLVVPRGDGYHLASGQVTELGLVTTAGIAVQALCLLPALARAGFSFRLRFDWRGTGLGKSVSAARWTLLFVLVNQIALAVVTRFANARDATDAHAGSAPYFFAQSLWILPQSVVTVSLVTAMLPGLTRAVAERRIDQARAALSQALRNTGALIVPAAFFFLALGPQLATLLFSYGLGGPLSARPFGEMLQAFALGLIPFSAQYVLLRGFYAFEDTRTPFWMAVWISLLDIALASTCHLWLPARYAVVGMAAAYAVSYLAGLLITAQRLRRRFDRRLDGRRVLRTYGRLVAAAALAGAAGWAVAQCLPTATGGSPVRLATSVLSSLTAGGLVMLAAFLLASHLFGITEVQALLRRLPLRRFSPRG
jgi:putative peptidoglycan lipid II flippase